MLVVLAFGYVIVILLGFWLAILVVSPLSKRGARYLAGVVVRYCAPMFFRVARRMLNFRVASSPDFTDVLPRHCLVISNHQSLLDIPLFMTFFSGRRLRFVAKQELAQGVPLISDVLRIQDHCIIPRTGDTGTAMERLDSFADRIVDQGLFGVIFPEGTRSRDGNMCRFYAAGFRRILTRRPMPVVACALEGSYRFATLGSVFRFMPNGCYRLKILKIYPPPQSKAEQLHILEESQCLMEAQLLRWREPPEMPENLPL
ncbi:MAG: 1-acyl-sn-glycerol-3-phosphate acyltransferase [Spirochaetaceae bacterium]|jgi:1-acyl-sn-glycerol-3-phosphate acyltransferase|nr:1-acyl-sn-glycerol-3-phosphate acyltransferase [Spirochaetaceae bacterium]